MKKLLAIIVISISASGCETYKQVNKDFKTFVSDVAINAAHPTDTQWRAGTSTNK